MLNALSLLALAVWTYDPAWVARHSRDHDVIARAVAPDIFPPAIFPPGVPLDGPPLNGSAQFKNPCWHEQGQLRCLPAFYLVGGFQCGVTDLGIRLAALRSPDIVVGQSVHAAFWSSGPSFGGDWPRFIKQMDMVTFQIAKRPSTALTFASNPAMLTFTWAESSRVHGAFSATVQSCWKRCRKEHLPPEMTELCKDKRYKPCPIKTRAQPGTPASGAQTLNGRSGLTGHRLLIA
mmetsp:Transcript_7982/g.20553  ORF Transcript_7982/g.20553 Transcript_7982/m.20553 type:complete len:234 (+) Transcript_7982:61-762(+)